MKQFFSLEGKTAVITGARQGIGLAAAERLSEAGAKVVLSDIQDCTEQATRLGGTAIKVDVTDEQQVESLMAGAREACGAIDIVVNNAGIFAGYNDLVDCSSVEFKACYEVNLMGVFYGIKHAVPLMNEGGSIINIGSVASVEGELHLASYVASKHAVAGVTKTAAIELGEKNIRVNCICPTTVDTPMAHEEGGEYLIEAHKIMVPLSRLCQPEEVASIIHFLAADDCGYVNGQVINLCGGATAGKNERMVNKIVA